MCLLHLLPALREQQSPPLKRRKTRREHKVFQHCYKLIFLNNKNYIWLLYTHDSLNWFPTD